MSTGSEVVAETALAIGLGGAGVWAIHRPSAPLVWQELRFPSALALAGAEAALSRVASGRSAPVFVIDAQAGRVQFRVGLEGHALPAVRGVLSGVVPELRLDDASAGLLRGATGLRLWWPTTAPREQSAGPEPVVAGLLGSLTALTGQERVMVMTRLAPVRRRPATPEATSKSVADRLAGPLVRAEILILATGPRARELQRSVADSFRMLGRGLRVRRLGTSRTERATQRLSRLGGLRLTPSSLLTPRDAVAAIGWPVGNPPVAGLDYGTAPRLPAPRELLLGAGRVIAQSNAAATAGRNLRQPLDGLPLHLASIGPTGSGKSTFIANMALQDIEAGRGLLLIDPRGDLVDDLLARIPEHRVADVIVLDPARAQSFAQPGLRWFPPGADPELSADVVLSVLRALSADSPWGIMTATTLRLGLSTLVHLPGANLALLPTILTDHALRNRALTAADNRRLNEAWERFDARSPGEQVAQLAPAMRRLEELLARGSLRVVLGQRHPRLHFGEVLARRRIVLATLSPGTLGGPAARLLSALVLWSAASATEARASLPPAKRRPFSIYVDEVAALGDLPLPLDGLLERARGLGVGLHLSPQHLGQLSPQLRASLLANVGSLVSFRLGAEEAKVVSRELTGVSAEQLQHLGRFEVAMRLALRPGQTTRTTTATTLPLADACRDPEALRVLSARRWGHTLPEVDRDLDDLLGRADDSPSENAPPTVGARRRTS